MFSSGKVEAVGTLMKQERIRDVQCHDERILERFKPYWASEVKVSGDDILRVEKDARSVRNINGSWKFTEVGMKLMDYFLGLNTAYFSCFF